jgi:hypothetical protein
MPVIDPATFTVSLFALWHFGFFVGYDLPCDCVYFYLKSSSGVKEICALKFNFSIQYPGIAFFIHGSEKD